MESGDPWSSLSQERGMVFTLPADRWALDSSFHLGKSHPVTIYSPRAGAIGDFCRSDATFFGIFSPVRLQNWASSSA